MISAFIHGHALLKNSVAGTVVLYHPDDSVLGNIDSYLTLVDRLYVLDNTENGPVPLLAELQNRPGIHCAAFGKNIGIAAALNYAAVKASEQGYHWLLTMDQDTRAENDIVFHMLESIRLCNSSAVGMICAGYGRETPYVERFGEKINEMLVCISAGSMINLNAFATVGPFLDKLFIDQVDHEMCLRLRKRRFKILQARDAVIRHRPGTVEKWGRHRVSIHNAGRKYFMTRNRLYVACKYKKRFPKFFRTETAGILKEVLKALWIEKNKKSQLKAILTGVLDFFNGNFSRNVNDL